MSNSILIDTFLNILNDVHLNNTIETLANESKELRRKMLNIGVLFLTPSISAAIITMNPVIIIGTTTLTLINILLIYHIFYIYRNVMVNHHYAKLAEAFGQAARRGFERFMNQHYSTNLPGQISRDYNLNILLNAIDSQFPSNKTVLFRPTDVITDTDIEGDYAYLFDTCIDNYVSKNTIRALINTNQITGVVKNPFTNLPIKIVHKVRIEVFNL